MDIPSPFGTDDADFDAADEFVPAHLPEPGPFLVTGDVDVLTGDAHIDFHRTTHDLFAERSVVDATFGYNLARLNLDARHPDAGFRYAAESADVLRAEFTPTTEFCPQSDSLCVGAFRAWNGLADRHDYAVVRVRVHPMHQRARRLNGRLRRLEKSRASEAGVDLAAVVAEGAAAAGLQAGTDDAAPVDEDRTPF